jgi:hypothetical protein
VEGATRSAKVGRIKDSSKSSLRSRAHRSTTTQCEHTQLVLSLSWGITGWRWEDLEGREWINEWEIGLGWVGIR